MPLRLSEIVVPSQESGANLEGLLSEVDISQRSEQKLEGDLTLVKLDGDIKKPESVIDLLEQRFSTAESLRIIALPVEAVIPRIAAAPSTESERKKRSKRVSR